MAFDGKKEVGRSGKRRRPLRSKSVPQSVRSQSKTPIPGSPVPGSRRANAPRRRDAIAQPTATARSRFGFLGRRRSEPLASRVTRPEVRPEVRPQVHSQLHSQARQPSATPARSQARSQARSPGQQQASPLRVLARPAPTAPSPYIPLRSLRPSRRRTLRRQPRKPRPIVLALRYIMRLLIVGIGLGVLAGTVLSSIDPSLRYTGEATQEQSSKTDAKAGSKTGSKAGSKTGSDSMAPKVSGLNLTREMSGLRSQLELRISANTGLTVGVFIVDLDTGSYLDINSRRQFSSASTIKLPILVALFEEIDAGNIKLDDQLTMKPELIAAEAGEMQLQPPGTQFSVLTTATEMIRISDNTATNLLIDRLGGSAKLNQRFQSWGLQQTQVRNLLPDVEGTNTISPNDLVTLMGRINQGEIVSLGSRDRLLGILRTTQTNDLLPQGLGPGAAIAHKTGNIGKAVGDVGLIDMPSGKRYIIMAMVERSAGDLRAEDLIRSISAETYQFLEATGSTSEQMPPPVPRSNIAEQEPKSAPSIMTTDP